MRSQAVYPAQSRTSLLWARSLTFLFNLKILCEF